MYEKSPNFGDMRIKDILIIFCGVIILLMSCNDKDDDGLIGRDLEIVEIIDPPDIPGIPGIYTQSLIQPKVKIRNNGTHGVEWFDVSYMIMTLDSVRQFGPFTRFDTILGPSEELIINLNEWGTISGNTPLIDGTYWIYVFFDVPQGDLDSPWNKKKNFIVEL